MMVRFQAFRVIIALPTVTGKFGHPHTLQSFQEMTHKGLRSRHAKNLIT